MSDNPPAPAAEIRPHELTIHGHTRVDNYYWLRQKSDPEVIAYLEQENAYTEAQLAHTKPLQEQLYQEMVDRIQDSDSTAPVKHGPYYYYRRTEAGKQYEIYCRRQGTMEAVEEVLLDLNQLAEKSDYLRLGFYRVSPDHQLLAYSLDIDGAEDFIIYFKELATGKQYAEEIPRAASSAEWAKDNLTFFYTAQDKAKRSYRCYRHVLGNAPEQDHLVYHEPDELYRVWLQKSKDGAYLVLMSKSIETSEARFLAADQPDGKLTLIQRREPGLRYSVDHRQGAFYLVTNDNQATNNKVVTAAVSHPAKDGWQELISHRENVKVDGIELFANHMVVYERKDGLQQLQVIDLVNDESHYVSFDEPVYTLSAGENPEYDSEAARFRYMSLTIPDSDFDYHMPSRRWELIKRKAVLGGYDPADYQSERIWATAEDGTRVRISLVYRKGLVKDSRNPCLLYGYGSYGANMDPAFSDIRFSLIDRGFVFAIAHIRGGQEMGRHWYDEGKFLKKKNTFTDFIACAQQLFEAEYTSPDLLAIMGRSAGGLLIGAVLNMAPELCKAAVAGVPFVDVITTMLDASIPLTAQEFEEWGNPKDETYYAYMLSYSPYDNVTDGAYPHLLITAGLNDPRVQYWEPAKWTAKLRASKSDDNMLLLRTFMGAGHFSSSGRYDYLRDIAVEYAFILDRLGQTS